LVAAAGLEILPAQNRFGVKELEMRIAVIGTGYVGLVSGACLADFGFQVTCIDTNADLIAALNRGESTFYEPGLAEILQRNIAAQRLAFSTNMAAIIAEADSILLAVGTPSRDKSGEADMYYINAAIEQLVPHCKQGVVIVTKSTVLVGTNAALREKIAALRPDLDFSLASNPEFLREGQAVADFTAPDRVVIGVNAGDNRAHEVLAQIYAPLVSRDIPVIITTPENAEMIKYAANAFLALKLTFINQVADLCEKLGGNIDEVAKAIGLDKRIGSAFLQAGPGFGGSCFPKDTLAFAATGNKAGAPQKLVENLIEINHERRRQTARRIIAAAETAQTKLVAVFGCAFKADTDDMRESPAIDVIAALLEKGLTVRLHDPQAMKAAQALFPAVQCCDSPYEAAKGAGVSVIMTEWDIYRHLDFQQLRQAMAGNILLDMRNLYSLEEMAVRGVEYYSVGRPPVSGS